MKIIITAIGIIFFIIGYVFNIWIEKNKHKEHPDFSGERFALIVVLQWACFLAGLYLADAIRGL